MAWLVIILLCVLILLLLIHNYQIRKQIHETFIALDDVQAGNLNRRLLTDENAAISELVYKINDIVIQDQKRILDMEKSEKAYRKLMTSLSHDIRTPLTSLIGYLDVLESDDVTRDEQERFLKIAKAKAVNLSDYIQSLFDWLRLESGEWVYQFENENICELTRQVLADWIMRLEKHDICFQFDIPEGALQLMIDKKAFERIMNNLLANIIKHSKATLLKVVIRSQENQVVICVSDNGIGIPKEDLPYVFDRLYKCDRSRTESSNGLGLSIAKELTTALNGTIQAQSSAGAGTAFVLTFPQNINPA